MDDKKSGYRKKERIVSAGIKEMNINEYRGMVGILVILILVILFLEFVNVTVLDG